jgi:hypothetical protein
VVVNTAEELDDLLFELGEDWDEKYPELNGEIDVSKVSLLYNSSEFI